MLILLGFIGGYGYGYGVRQQGPNGTTVVPGATPTPAKAPPDVRGLRVSPNDRYLAMTAVFDQARLGARVILDLKSGRYSEEQSPVGWQDYITQWSADNKKILFERERIPRSAAEATAGMYAATVGDDTGKPDSNPTSNEPELLTQTVNIPGEKIIAGFWTPQDQLVLKTRREPKSLFMIENGKTRLIDRAGINYQQHRAVREGKRLVFYTVRDVPGSKSDDGSGIAALFRVVDGKATRLSDDLSGAVWVYLEENARSMVVCRQGEGGNWQWTAYSVNPTSARLVKTASVPGDVGSVYWSPDGKYILGAGGKSLWIIDIPTLKSHQLTPRTDWNADDACWLNHEKAILVATDGVISKVTLSGAVSQAWKFPQGYWR